MRSGSPNKEKLVINCLNPGENSKLLYKLLVGLDPNVHAITQEMYPDLEIAPEVRKNVVLSHRIVCRPSESDSDNPLRYEVLAMKKESLLGSGTFGAVYPVLATIMIDEDSRLIYKTHKNRVIKASDVGDIEQKEIAEKENVLGRLTPHLRPKELSRSKGYEDEYGENIPERVLGVMARQPGKNLKAMLPTLKTLTARQRVELTYEILKSYQNQLSKPKIVHRDLNYGNVMLAIENGLITVNFLDLGLSQHDTTGDKYEQGSYLYTAPESIRSHIANERSDMFSLGMLIAHVWNVNENFGLPNDFNDFIAMKCHPDYKIDLAGLFDGVDDVADDVKLSIKALITFLTKTNPAERFSLDLAVMGAYDIRYLYFKGLEGSVEVDLLMPPILATEIELEAPNLHITPVDVAQYKQLLFSKIDEVPSSPHCLDYFVVECDLPVPLACRDDKQKVKDSIEVKLSIYEDREISLKTPDVIRDALRVCKGLDQAHLDKIFSEIESKRDKFIESCEAKYSQRKLTWDNLSQIVNAYRGQGTQLADRLINEVESNLIQRIVARLKAHNGDELVDVKNNLCKVILRFVGENDRLTCDAEDEVKKLLKLIDACKTVQDTKAAVAGFVSHHDKLSNFELYNLLSGLDQVVKDSSPSVGPRR